MRHLIAKIRHWLSSPVPPSVLERVLELESRTKAVEREVDDLHEAYRRLAGRKNALLRHDAAEETPTNSGSGGTTARAAAGVPFVDGDDVVPKSELRKIVRERFGK